MSSNGIIGAIIVAAIIIGALFYRGVFQVDESGGLKVNSTAAQETMTAAEGMTGSAPGSGTGAATENL